MTADQPTRLPLRFLDKHPTVEPLKEAVLSGLAKTPKSIPSKFLYDERGSELFEQITALEEYYPTRTEMALLKNKVGEIAGLVGHGAQLIEFGAGSLEKVRILLEALDEPACYVPIDISGDFLKESAEDLAEDFPDLEIVAICADYNQPLDIPAPAAGPPEHRLGFFPGSTIGNFTAEGSEDFLRNAARIIGSGAYFLIGADLEKDIDVLKSAYDDSRGVTAEFNRNLLQRMNRELDADFDLSRFRHEARFNSEECRIEMHLVSLAEQTVTVAGRQFHFAEGETIHTENSHKYTLERFRGMADRAGFETIDVWTDRNAWFSLHLLRVR